MSKDFCHGRRKSSCVAKYPKYAHIALRQNSLLGSFDYGVEDSSRLKEQKLIDIFRNIGYLLAVSFGKYIYHTS